MSTENQSEISQVSLSNLKVVIDKKGKKILYGEADEEFIDERLNPS